MAKHEVVVARSDQSTVQRVGNELAALQAWIADLPGPCAVLMESTGRYHQLLAEALHAAGHRVYLVNGLKLSQYRKSVGQRAKTDPSDARLLLRYLQHEHAALTPWRPTPENISAIRTLLKRRSEVIKHTVALRQSFSDVPQIDTAEVIASLKATVAKLDRLINGLIEHQDIKDEARRCRQITGVGPLTSAALTATYYAGNFTRVDAFIAFIGLDLIANDSGRKTGRRRLSKKGDSEVRRLLHNAAMSACRVGKWKQYYERYLARGFERTQALVILARKIARVAFSLLKTGRDYDEALLFGSA
ncbi:MAG: transposase [Pseudomonadota bacterium]